MKTMILAAAVLLSAVLVMPGIEPGTAGAAGTVTPAGGAVPVPVLAAGAVEPVQGLLVASQTAQMPALKPGLVEDQLREGQLFAKGARVNFVRNLEVETDLEMCRLQLLAAQEKQKYTAEFVEVQRKLLDNRIIAVSEMKKAEFEDRQAAIETKNLGEKKKFLTSLAAVQRLPAPFDGRVTKVLKQSGEYAEAGQPVCELAQTGLLHAVCHVPEADWRGFEVGERHQLLVSGREVRGILVIKAAQIDAATKLGKMVFEVNNLAGELFPGQTVIWKGRQP